MNKKFNKKKLAMFIVPILALMLVSAVLVDYFAQMQVDMDVAEAITMTGGVCEFDTIAGGDYKLCLMSITNNLDKEVPVSIKLEVQKQINGVYVTLEDDEGFLVGLTEDVSYAYKIDHNDPICVTDECAKTWMEDNPNWLDWEILTQPYPGEYDISIINDFGKADYVPLTNGILTLPYVIPGEYHEHWAMYVDSSSALVPGSYRVIFEIIPVTA